MKKWIPWLAVVLVTLSAFDALATLWQFSKWTGVYEANPILGPLLSWSPVFFVAAKILVVAFAATVIVLRGGRVGFWALASVNVVYLGIAAWHVVIFLVPTGGGW